MEYGERFSDEPQFAMRSLFLILRSAHGQSFYKVERACARLEG